MRIKLITIPFENDKNGFDDEALQEFLTKVDVIDIETQFFIQKIPYWSYSIKYTVVEKSNKKEIGMNFNEKEVVLYDKLKEWRNAEALKKGFPPYLIATNKQLEELTLKRPKTIEGFKLIDGLGKKKASDYGKEILEMVNNDKSENLQGGKV